MKGRKLQSRNSKNPDLREVVSRKEVCAATINMSGRCGLGLTPKYKVDIVKDVRKSHQNATYNNISTISKSALDCLS